MLQRVLHRHQAEVSLMGFTQADIGTHSIRKGAITFMSSLPSGPSVAAICIRAGWTLGNVKDIYMKYLSAGDQFVGRCLSLLPLLKIEFAASPPFFLLGFEAWAIEYRQHQFPMIAAIPAFQRLTMMCLASLVYHRGFIVESFTINHPVHAAGSLFRDQAALDFLSENETVMLTYPWNDTVGHKFTGVPPHVCILQQVTSVRVEQKGMADRFLDKMKSVIEEAGVGGGQIMEQRLRAVFETFADEIRNRLPRNNEQPGDGDEEEEALRQIGDRVERDQKYKLHTHSGFVQRLPFDWRFPRLGVFDAWKQWWIGDTVRNIPPLRGLIPNDVRWLDRVPLSEVEKHGRTGPYKNNRRLSRKVLSDLRNLMDYITDKVRAAGAFPAVITLRSVIAMFQVVADEFEGARREQKKWLTVYKDLKKRQDEERERNNNNEENA